MDHCLATALKESKPVYISVCCNLAGAVHPSFHRESVFTFLDHLYLLVSCEACLRRRQLKWCDVSCFSSDDIDSLRRGMAIAIHKTRTNISAMCSIYQGISTNLFFASSSVFASLWRDFLSQVQLWKLKEKKRLCCRCSQSHLQHIHSSDIQPCDIHPCDTHPAHFV